MKRSCLVALLCIFLCCACGKTEESQVPDVVAFVEENWPQFSEVAYDAASASLTLTQTTQLSYDAAKAHGAEVYQDELSLESYLDIVYLVSYDVRSACGLETLHITLEGRSRDGQTIYTVSDSGEITACWES